MIWIFQFCFGIFYGQWLEWLIHKHLMHGIGKKRNSTFSYHFHSHHRASRQNMFHDESYEGKGEGMYKEVRDLCVLCLIHSPLLMFAPAVYAGSLLNAALYFFMHRKSHLEPEWCKKHMPWHYDHHMAPNQDANWGVTTDWIDRLMGTREVYLGTTKEQTDTARRLARLTN